MVQANPVKEEEEKLKPVDFTKLFANMAVKFDCLEEKEEEKVDTTPVVVGKALSETHKRAMIKHACIQPVMPK